MATNRPVQPTHFSVTDAKGQDERLKRHNLINERENISGRERIRLKKKVNDLFRLKNSSIVLNDISNVLEETNKLHQKYIKNIIFDSRSKETASIKDEYSKLTDDYFKSILDNSSNSTILNSNIDNIISETKMKKASDWFSRKIKNFMENKSDISESNNIYSILFNSKRNRVVAHAQVGEVYMMCYYPKYRNILPKYDMFPLFLVLGYKGNKLMGLNLHYVNTSSERLKLLRACVNKGGGVSDKEFNSLILERMNSVMKSEVFVKNYNEVKTRADNLINEKNRLTKRMNEIDSILNKENISQSEIDRLSEELEIIEKQWNDFDIDYKEFKNSPKRFSSELVDLYRKTESEIGTKGGSIFSEDGLINSEGYKTYSKECFKYYITNGGNIIQNRLVWIPPSEYNFIVNLPPAWVENKK